MSFKKNLILMALFLAGTLYAYRVEYIGGLKEAEQKRSEKLALSLKPGQAERITIEYQGEKAELLLKKGKWQIISPVAVPADNDAVREILKTASELEFDEIVSESEKNLSEFGLAPPVSKVEIFLNGAESPETILVGGPTPNYRKVYGKSGKVKGIFTAGLKLRAAFSKTVFQLRDRRIFKIDPAKSALTAFEYQNGSDISRLEKEKDGSWNIVFPITAKADDAVVGEFVNSVLNAGAVGFVNERPDMKGAGLDPPLKKVTFFFSDKANPVSLNAGIPYNNRGEIIANVSGSNEIPLLSQEFFSRFPQTADGFRAGKLFDIPFEELSKVSIARDGKKFMFEKNGSMWIMLTPEKRGLNTQDFADLALSIINLEYVSKEPAGPADSNIQATIVLENGNGGKKAAIDLIGYNDDKTLIRAKLDGKPGEYLVPAQFLETINLKRLEGLM